MALSPDIMVIFAVNLIYIVTNVYGYLLKRFFVPDIYKKDAAELFPARRSVAQFYLLQLFEVPYLFMLGRPEALFYVNGSGLLVFSSFILVIVRKYFFLQTSSLRKRLLFLLPMWACWVALVVPLFLPAVFTPRYQWTMTAIILVLFAGYMFHLDPAHTADYPSRFKLVFSANGADENDNFAFVDASGNLIVNGTGMVQIIDMLGRVLVTRDANDRISTEGLGGGVYVLRLINGNNVKTQKIVLRYQ